MKMVHNIILVLAAAITLTLSGCNPASEPTTTPDEIPVVATADEAQTEPTTITEETTVAETTVAETTVPEPTAEVTEPTTENKEPEKTEEKVSNSSSSGTSNTSTGNNSSSGSQTSNKPSSNTSSGSNSSGSSTNNKPAETKPVVITDDTPLTYEEFVNDKNIQRLCDDINAYFIAKGMIYTPSLNKDNTGWFYGYCSAMEKTAVRSYNQEKARTITCLDEQVEAVLVGLAGHPVDTWTFNCYYGIDCDGYYNIYFCYQ